MPGGLNLGGAFFTIYGDNEQVLRSMAQAKAATQQATTAMANAQKAYAAAAMSSNASVINMNVQVAEQWVRTAQVATGAIKSNVAVLDAYGISVGKAGAASSSAAGQVNKLTQAQQAAAAAAAANAKAQAASTAQLAKIGSTLATLTGFGAIASGALLVRETLLAVAEAAQKLNQEQFRLQKQFGAMAPVYQQQAEALAQLSGRSIADAIAATNTFATVQKQYGVSTAQLVDLQKRAADAAAVTGVSLEEAAKRIAPALRGEAESIEFLGFSLQSDYLRALQDVTSAEYKRWQQMGPLEKTQKILLEFQKQSNEQTGAAAERAASAAGAYDKMSKATTDLAGAMGQALNPALVKAADLFSKLSTFLVTASKDTAEYQAAVDQLMAEKQVPEWLRFLIGQTSFTGKGNPLVESVVAANRALKEQAAEFARISLEQKQQRDVEQEQRNNQIKFLVEAGKKAIDDQVEAENKAYETAKARLQAEKDAKLDAVEAKRDAALAGIAAEKQAAEDLYETQLAQLQQEKETALQVAEARHTAARAALDAERDAVNEASEAQQRRIKDEAEAADRASEERLRVIKDALEQEERARDAARVIEDRALEDDTTRKKQALADQHEAVLEAIEQEEQAVRAGAEKALRRIEEQGKRADRRHEQRLRQIEDQNKAAEKAHDAAVRAIEAEGEAAQKRHDGIVRGIQDETDAAEKAHDTLVRGLEDEQKRAEKLHEDTLTQIEAEQKVAEKKHDDLLAAIETEGDAAKKIHDDTLKAIEVEGDAAEKIHDDALRAIGAEQDAAEARHKALVRGLSDELDAAEARHKAVVRGLSDEQDAAEDTHRSIIRGLKDEEDAAQAVHDAARQALERRKRAEDERHRAVIANQEDELRQQLAFLDASLDAADAAAEAVQHANKLADLQDKLSKARSTGNASEIAEAERAIADELADAQRDSLKDQLEAKRDALVAGGKLAKDAADAEHQQIENAIEDAGRLADAQLAAVKASTDARKQAADDELARIKTGIEARRQAADDELARIKTSVDARRQAADDELARIKAILDARKVAADDAFAQIKALLDARKAAADEELKKILELLKGRKDQADAEYALVRDLLQGRKDAADAELKKIKEVLDAKKLAADDELARIKDVNDKRKVAADDELLRVKDGLAAKKLALDEEKLKRQEVFDDAKTKLEDQERREKDALDKKKIRIGDERDAALLALKAKRDKEEDDNQELDRREAAALIETKRKIADRRTAEDLAAKDARAAAEETARLEQLQIKDTKDAAILASKDALDAYTRDYGLRTKEVDAQYNNEKTRIHETFDDPQTGLIPKLKRAYEDTKEWYDKRTTEVNLQYKNEKEQIEDTFNHAEHGLFAQLANVHKATVDALKETKKDWEEGFQKPILDVAGKTFEEIQKLFNELKEKNKLEAIGPVYGPPVPKDWKPGDGGGGMGGRVAGGGYRPVVDDATSNSYWTDTGTHRGGPAADIFAPKGSNIRAPVSGYSNPARYSLGGNATTLRGDDGRWYYFAHANDSMKGGRVEAGEVIGHVGTTGNAEGTSPHLHTAIASSPDVFGDRNGSGDIWGDDSWWTGQGSTAPPGSGGDGDYITFFLFGQEYRIKLPSFTAKGGALIKAIQKLGESIAGKEFGRVAAAVADSEGADGNLDKPGSGGARGPFQFDPGGELKHYAKFLHMSMDDAGDYAGKNPLHAARYALSGGSGGFSGEGYLGRAIKSGQDDEGLSGAGLAEFASQYGQRPRDDLWKRAGESYRKLFGYARGGLIPEPTLLVGQTMGPYAIAGESAPEWVTPNPQGVLGEQGPMRTEMPIYIGNREVERLWIDGYHLNVRRGRTFSGTGGR